MKRGLIPAALIVAVCGCGSEPPSLERSLSLMPSTTVKVMGAENAFSEAYELRLEQPLDHQNPDAGSFEQRVTIEHRGYDRPVVFITEGYSLGENQVAELAEMLGANQVRMEHRYEGQSAPDELQWEHLNIAQAAADAHRVRELLADIYPGPWISTGWSKGGQTAVIYRWLYPDDVAATVAYDAPLPRALEDPRIDAHFEAVGTAECRDRLTAFQRALLENKDELLPLFRWYARGQGWGLSVGEEKVFEYAVLEFPFSFWQYSVADCGGVPWEDADPEMLLGALVDMVAISWFSDETLESPSFHQFCTELGFYGYDEGPFVDLLSAADYPMCIYAPDWTPEDYDPETMQKLDHWLRTEAVRVMSIYGDVDPWSAPSMPVGVERDQIQFWSRGGNHFTFIRSLSGADQVKARKTLATWIGVPIEEVGE